MELTLERLVSDGEATIGALFVEDRFQCFTLEDEFRAEKRPGETRIPAGRYAVRLRRQGALHPKYAARYGALHKGMLWLQDVPGFDWIYLHTGNTDAHTAGCILVGEGALTRAGDMSLQASRDAYRRLARAVMDSAERGGLSITIQDRDR